MKSSRAALSLILLVAFLIRAGWGLMQPTDDRSLSNLPDQVEYLSLGKNLLNGNGLQFADPRFENQAIYAYRTPGYPALIALCGANVRVIRTVQAVIDASTVLAIFLLARFWLSERASVFAAALIAFNPFLIYFSSLILSETLFTAMLAWGMVLLVRRSWPAMGWYLLALAVLVRPSAILLPLILTRIGSILTLKNPRRQLVGLRMALITLVMLLPWAARNHRVLGRWIWTTTNGGITLYDGFNPAADGSSNQAFLKTMPDVKHMGELKRSDYFGSLARQYIRENPGRALQLAARKIDRTWSPLPLSEQYGKPIYVAAGLIYSIPLDLLVIAGLWKGRLPRAAKAFLMAPAVYFTVVHALSVGSLRYRVPVEAPMAVIAASAVASLLGRSKGDDADSPVQDRSAL